MPLAEDQDMIQTVAPERPATWPPGEVDVFPQDVDGLIEVFDPDIRPQIEDQRQAAVWPV
jgi:hypothetical protein